MTGVTQGSGQLSNLDDPLPSQHREEYLQEHNSNAKLVSTSPQSIALAAARLRSGDLVAFPTETVYGLGCHALDPSAIHRVFTAKERPLTDPLIVHVCEPVDAWPLWQATSTSTLSESSCRSPNANEIHSLQRTLIETITSTFWPGPLTVVAKAASHIPSVVMANTGFVACRSPSHPIARQLIHEAKVPIAAPSANKFGHVSPTRASHVFDDLWMEDVWILDPSFEDVDKVSKVEDRDHVDSDDNNKKIDSSNSVCQVGVESTVAKIEIDEDGNRGKILILRHGAISAHDILKCLQQSNLSEHIDVLDNMMQSTKDTVSHVAPGQSIRHYSPNVPSYMVATSSTSVSNCSKSTSDHAMDEDEIRILGQSVVIDFGGKLVRWKEYSLAYRDLSVDGDSNVAASRVFDTLRWSEQIAGAERVFFPALHTGGIHGNSSYESTSEIDPLLQALQDRLTRAASGQVIHESQIKTLFILE